MSAPDADVVVVGGGPVGLAVCAGLAHHGVEKVVLLDPDPGGVRESRAFGVRARTCETLRDWGMFEELRDRGSFERVLEPLDGATGRRLFRFDFGVLDAESPTAGVLIAPQYLTEQVMHHHVRANTATEVVAATVETITEKPEGVVVSARRADNELLRVTARFVVGCDGAHSTVRHQIGQHLQGRTYPTRMVLADVRPDSDAGLGPMRFSTQYPGFLAGVRFGERLWRVMATVDEGDAAGEQAWTSRLGALFGDRSLEVLWRSEFALYRRAVSQFRVGRVLLAGDAAHLISPAGGQGMNSGIQDAENLAWKLTAALAYGDTEQLLTSYDTERRGLIVTDVGRTAEWTQRVEFGMPTWAKPTLLQLLDAAARVRPIATRLARQFSMLGHRYPQSPLLHGQHPLLGVRLSDPHLHDGRRLSDHLQGRAGYITVGDDAQHMPTMPCDLIHVTMQHPPSMWRLSGPAMLIVRPDRHVGAVIEPHNHIGMGPRAAAAVALGAPSATVSP